MKKIDPTDEKLLMHKHNNDGQQICMSDYKRYATNSMKNKPLKKGLL